MNSNSDYKYKIEDCDVDDKKKCTEFREKRKQWIDWLFGEDHHSIQKQIDSMLHFHFLSLCINNLGELAENEPNEGVGFNEDVMWLFDLGFITVQSIAIRRITDKPEENPNKSINSLHRILKDIKNYSQLINRENYVCYDGFPYDYEAVENKWRTNLLQNNNKSLIVAPPRCGPEAFSNSQDLHENFDRLSKTDPNNRKRTDLINIEQIEHLENKLKGNADINYIRELTNKYIAHAADPANRKEFDKKRHGEVLDKMQNSIKIIFQVANFISQQLLYQSNCGGLQGPIGVTKNLDKGWGTKENIQKVSDQWPGFQDKVNKWNSESLWPPDY